ncbi:hypothetical protein AARAC_003591 [Aspergillus arachidicola]|uniref:Uncharacterized protein n=1 Tax=Aspergillus arachidicola TaxID=656916 RepID=A0A2G7FEF2_9EURO|nr:hypothetical protein AARAC_003591 [Aspergillus arachidicola]
MTTGVFVAWLKFKKAATLMILNFDRVRLRSKFYKVLKSAEDLNAAYEEAFQKNKDLQAEANIDFLTSSNGPLVNGIYKISSLTKDMKVKRQLLTTKLMKIRFTEKKFDLTILLDATSALVSLGRDPKSILDSIKQGYETYKKATDDSTAKTLHGDAVKKEYIVDRLAQCSETFE